VYLFSPGFGLPLSELCTNQQLPTRQLINSQFAARFTNKQVSSCKLKVMEKVISFLNLQHRVAASLQAELRKGCIYQKEEKSIPGF